MTGKALSRIGPLVQRMDQLSEETWRKVAYGPRRNVRFREDGITSHNLFELDQSHPWLRVWSFTGHQEARNGADWEWWIGNDRQGWVCLRVQAKRLSENRRYLELDHRVGEEEDLQVDLLIKSSRRDSSRWSAPVIPLYCFYNGWVDDPSRSPRSADANWPIGVQCLACPNDSTPHDCVHASLRAHGCAMASAYLVRQRMETEERPYSLERYLPLSIPWSRLFTANDHLLAAKPAIARQSGAPFKPSFVAEGVLGRTQWLWQQALEWLPDGSPDDLAPWDVLGGVPMDAPGSSPAPYVRLLAESDSEGLTEVSGAVPNLKALALLEVPIEQ